MGILSWFQRKFSVKQEKRMCDASTDSTNNASIPEACKEEQSDIPQLLAIGTFGSDEFEEDMQRVHDSSKSMLSLENLPGFTVEEVMRLQKEVNKLLASKHKLSNNASEVDQERDMTENSDNCSPSLKIIFNKENDLSSDNSKAIKHKSIKFLLKKMFVSKNDFAQLPHIRDSMPESRMKKFLKSLLHKKIIPQSSTTTLTSKYLQQNPKERTSCDSEMLYMREDDAKWVKTDSDFIVLEMTK